jgi:hypothetical protein
MHTDPLPGPLAGIRVLELGQFFNGPHAGLLMGAGRGKSTQGRAERWRRPQPRTDEVPAIGPDHTALMVMDYELASLEYIPDADQLLKRVVNAIALWIEPTYSQLDVSGLSATISISRGPPWPSSASLLN